MSRGGRVVHHRGRHNNAAYANMHNEVPHNNSRQHRDMPQRRRKILGENTYRILIKESKVKVVLGPEGRHIKEIKEECNEPCQITIHTHNTDGEPFPPKSPDRILNLECSVVDLENVLIKLIPHLQMAAPEFMINKDNEIRLVVPEFVCRTIIGEQDINVENIQRDFHSSVRVHKDPLPYSTEFVVSLTNKDVTCLAASVNRIYESIKSIKSISHVNMFNPIMWIPGKFGDTGSYIEEINVRPQVLAQEYNPEPEEPRYDREKPRFHNDNRMHRSQGFSNRQNNHSFNDYESNRSQNGRGHSMRGQGYVRGQNMRGRNYHRGGRQIGKSRGMQKNQHQLDPNIDQHHSGDSEDYRNDHYSDDTVTPRQPKGFSGRGWS